MSKKILCIMLSAILAVCSSATVFADENAGVEKSEISVLKQFIDKVIDIPITHIDDPATEKDETTNTVYGKPEGYSYTTGDVKEGDDDLEYNYKVFTILKQGDITVETTNVDIEKKSKNLKLDYLKNQTTPTGKDGNDLAMGLATIIVPENVKKQIGADYEYIYLGSDKQSVFKTAHGWNKRQPVYDPNETGPVYEDDKYTIYVTDGGGQVDADGEKGAFSKRGLIVDRYYLGDNVVMAEEGKKFYARWADNQQFVLSDENGNLLTAYCADQKTDAVKEYRYNIENLEDATYYTEEEAGKIRAIAKNGYWGTASGVGSLEAVKEMMKDSKKFKNKEIEDLTDGMALMATQYAIWTYSNAKDKVVFLNAFHKLKNNKFEQAAVEDTDLIFKLYRHLVKLDPITPADKSTKQRAIINENNFIEKASMKITDSMKDAPENNDEDNTNDVFKADVSFTLAMTQEDLKDDNLIMQIKDGKGNILATGRIAGQKQDDEVKLTPNSNNEYTFKDVPMHEGKQNIMFDLSGEQKLDNAPYLLTSEVKEDGSTSQTFVCFASGEREVSMVMDITCEITVNAEEFEENHTYKNPPNDPTGDEFETGDAFNLLLVVTILLISLAGAGLVLSRRKYN